MMTWRDLVFLPKIRRGFRHVWTRNFLADRKSWWISILWTCLEPLMYLAALGYGLGAYVTNLNGQSYVEFLFPGLLASTAMMVAFIEGSFGSHSRMTTRKTYAMILTTPTSTDDIVFGEILWATSKAIFGCVGVALVASAFGLVNGLRIFPAFLMLLAVAWLFASLAMIATSLARGPDSFTPLTSGLLIPMTLLSGLYFPVEQLPDGLRHFAWLLPLTHAVAAVRNVLSGGLSWAFLGHLGFILVLGWLAMNIAIRLIRRRLID